MKHDVITVVLLLVVILGGYAIFTYQGNNESVKVYEPNGQETVLTIIVNKPTATEKIRTVINDVLADYTMEEIHTKRREITNILNGRLEKYGVFIKEIADAESNN